MESESSDLDQLFAAFTAFLHDAEDSYNLPHDFIIKLLTAADDWSLVVKLHALAEAAVKRTLMFLLGSKLADQVENLRMARRIEWLKAFGALTGEHLTFAKKFGEMRNAATHDIAKIASFSLRTYGAETLDVGMQRLVFFGSEIGAASDFDLRAGLWRRTLYLMFELCAAENRHLREEFEKIERELDKRRAAVQAALQEEIQKLLTSS